MGLIYSPEEDSFLLSDVLGKELVSQIKLNPELIFLEIGCGSGIQLKTAWKSGIKKKNIFGSDVNFDAVKKCKEQKFNCVQSNLFEKIAKKFDIIAFNPPYLPEDGIEDCESKTITTGGVKGGELINKFLKEAKNHLNLNGKIYLLVSSLTKGVNLLDYKKNIVGEKKLFFEKLEVWELSF